MCVYLSWTNKDIKKNAVYWAYDKTPFWIYLHADKLYYRNVAMWD